MTLDERIRNCRSKFRDEYQESGFSFFSEIVNKYIEPIYCQETLKLEIEKEDGIDGYDMIWDFITWSKYPCIHELRCLYVDGWESVIFNEKYRVIYFSDSSGIVQYSGLLSSFKSLIKRIF
jgi:hypothetical protein